LEVPIRFEPVEVISQVWFVFGENKHLGCTVTSILLLPVNSTGTHIVMEISLPEIFFQ